MPSAQSAIQWLGIPMVANGAVGGAASGAVGVSATASLAHANATIKAKWGFHLEDLRKLPEWDGLYNAIKNGLKTSCRRVLSHHATTACQPQKQEGVVMSLNSVGLDTPIEVDLGKRIKVRITVPNAYSKGDGHEWQITSEKCPTLKKAQEDLCMTAVVWLLANQPEAVRLPPNGCCVPDVRLSGASIHTEVPSQKVAGRPVPASSWLGLWNVIVRRAREPNATIHVSGKCACSVSGAHAVH